MDFEKYWTKLTTLTFPYDQRSFIFLINEETRTTFFLHKAATEWLWQNTYFNFGLYTWQIYLHTQINSLQHLCEKEHK